MSNETLCRYNFFMVMVSMTGGSIVHKYSKSNKLLSFCVWYYYAFCVVSETVDNKMTIKPNLTWHNKPL